MKKIIIALLIACSVKAQTIVWQSTDTICPGDTLCVKIYNPDHAPFYFNMLVPNELHWWEIWPDSTTMDTTVYCFDIPLEFEQGLGEIGINLEGFFKIVIYCPPSFVGIAHYFIEQINPVYFDMNGNIVTPTPGLLLIEQVGLTRRKVLIQR